VSNSGYVLEGNEGSLCRWQSKLRHHLVINDTHVRKALNNIRQQLAGLSQSPMLICASSRLVNLANEGLRKKGYHLEGLLVKRTILKYLRTTCHQRFKQRTCFGIQVFEASMKTNACCQMQ